MRMQITDAVKHLIIINAIMFLGTLTVGNGEWFYQWFALYFPQSPMFQPWQIVTHMFMHGNFMHILFNMFALWMFGSAVEQVFDTKKFIIFYLLSGLGAAVIQIAFLYFQFNTGLGVLVANGGVETEILNILEQGKYDTRWTKTLGDNLTNFISAFNSTMVGASGAIMGVLVAFGMLFPNAKLMLIFLPVPVKAKYFIPGIILMDLISAFTGNSIFSPSNTAFMAHVGGAVTGFLLMYFWRKNENDKYRWN